MSLEGVALRFGVKACTASSIFHNKFEFLSAAGDSKSKGKRSRNLELEFEEEQGPPRERLLSSISW